MPNDDKPWQPTWLYRLKNNKPEAQLFLSPPSNPDEWHDHPQEPRKPGRPPKAEASDGK